MLSSGTMKSSGDSLFSSTTALSISPISPSAKMPSEPNSAMVTNALLARTCLATRSMFLDVTLTSCSWSGMPLASVGMTMSPSTGMFSGMPASILLLSISLKSMLW